MFRILTDVSLLLPLPVLSDISFSWDSLRYPQALALGPSRYVICTLIQRVFVEY